MTTTSHKSSRRSDNGFTVIEILVTVVLLGMVTSVIAAAVIVIFRSEEGVVASTSEAHDTRQIVSYLPLDIASGPSKASAYRATTGGASGDRGSGCSDTGNDNVLRIDITDRRLDLVERRIAYRIVTATDEARIDRYECSYDTATSTWVSDQVLNIADYLDPTASPVAEAIVHVSNPLEPDPAKQLVSNVELQYVQRGDTESIVAAPREEPPLANEGVCTSDPLEAAQNMAAFFETDVTLNNTTVKGALYVGGTLTFTGTGGSAGQANPPAPTPPVGANVGFLVGSINWAGSSGQFDVKSHHDIVIEDGLFEPPNANGQKSVRAPGVNSGNPRVLGGSGATVSAGSGTPIVDPTEAFATLRACSDRLAGLPDTCNNSACASHVGVSGSAPNYTFDLAPDGIANALNITDTQLASLGGGSISFTGGVRPTADRPLIVNVSSTPGATVSFQAASNLQGQGTSAAHVLYNFPNAGRVEVQAGSKLWGSILAPYADVESDADIEGGVIARTFVMNGGTLHDVRYFEGNLAW